MKKELREYLGNQKAFLGKVFFALMLLISCASYGQAISSILYGQNAFMPDTVGTTPLYGKLHSNWQKIEDSHVQIIRYGGNDADNKMTSNYQYLKIIDSARAHGMEPIIQVPFDNYAFSSTQAANLVTYINVTHGKNIVYWSIGNEENNNHGYGASSIATYIKAYASAMKAADNSIKILGPELAGYNYTIMSGSGGLLYGTPGSNANNITGTDANGRYYVDIITFHTYPMGDLYVNGSPTRAAIIANLRTSSAGHFKYDLHYLDSLVAISNSTRSGSPLKVAVTEANFCYSDNVSDDGVGGLGGANSFIAGQFWAEMLEIAMEEQVEFVNFWSVIEGSPSYHSNATNVGYVDNASPYNVKPTYYHFQMVAENFSGTYCAGTTTHSNTKVFGSITGSNISVMMMNEDASNDYSYTLNLNTSGSGSIKINASNSGTHSGTLYHQSSVVLVFDLSGNLLKECVYKETDSSPNCTTYTPCTAPTASSNSPVCQSATLNLYASTISGATYSWTGPNSFTSSSQNPVITGVGVVNAGTYSVTATVGTCTSSSGTTTVTVPNFASIGTGGPTTFCSGGSVALYASTGTGYSWQWIKNGTNIGGATANNYTATTSGDYQVKIYNGTCYAWSAPTTVTVNSTPSAPTAGSNSPVCQSATINLTASTISGATYSWTGPNSFSSSSQNPSISGAGVVNAGTYSVTATVGGCTSSAGTTTVTVPDFASIGVGGSTTFCSGGSVALYASTGTGYSWQWIKNGTNISGATANNYSATTSGDYQVKIYNGTCYAWSAPITVTINSSLVATVTPAGSTTVCSPATVLLYGNTCSGYTYQWQKKDGSGVYQPISGATSANYTATVSGWYQVEVSSGGSHQWSAGVQVTINSCRLAGSNTAENSSTDENSLSVFPNPNKGEFTIMINMLTENNNSVTVDILNSLGQLVYSTGKIVAETNAQIPISIDAGQPNGIYMVRVTTESKTMYSLISVQW